MKVKQASDASGACFPVSAVRKQKTASTSPSGGLPSKQAMAYGFYSFTSQLLASK